MNKGRHLSLIFSPYAAIGAIGAWTRGREGKPRGDRLEVGLKFHYMKKYPFKNVPQRLAGGGWTYLCTSPSPLVVDRASASSTGGYQWQGLDSGAKRE